MLVSEFIDRTGYQPTAEEYAEIEQAYYVFDGDKDAFCKAWSKANPHKAGKLWAAIKEQEREGKVFDRLCAIIRRMKKADYTKVWELQQSHDYDGQRLFVREIGERIKSAGWKETRDMIDRLEKSCAITSCWSSQQWEFFRLIQYWA